MLIDVAKVLIPTALTFTIGILITPFITHYLYKYKCWKKKGVQAATDGGSATISQQLHNDEERKTPRMGGIVVWGSVIITTLLLWLFSAVDGTLAEKMNFLSRNQTWLPLFMLIVGALVGFVDDYFAVHERYDQKAGGLSAGKRLFAVFMLGVFGAWWFYFKLGAAIIFVPFFGDLFIGVLFIPLFIIVMLGIFAGGVIDGLDGLSGGVFASIFSAYGFIAYFQDQIDLAALSFAIVGALLAFLWFNIPPARFFLSDTGTMALTPTLAVIAFLTDQVVVLPIIAFMLVAAAGSSSLQLLSKKIRGKKIFIVAPFHHHLQAIGWPAYKVTMRLWILSMMFATVGTIIALIG